MAYRREFFERTETLTGPEGLDRLRDAHVAVFGVGGVGSWCAEALVRSGVGHLLLVDDDVVAPSNVNRQAPAAADTIGKPKSEVLRNRLLAVHPDVEIEARVARYTPETASSFDLGSFVCVVDAIDSVPCKAHLIREALSHEGTAFFSSMGAARKLDPFRVKTTEFRKIEGDGLARAVRNRLKQTGGLPERKFDCVWSDEPSVGNPDIKGSLMTVTAAFGLGLASLVLKHLISR